MQYPIQGYNTEEVTMEEKYHPTPNTPTETPPPPAHASYLKSLVAQAEARDPSHLIFGADHHKYKLNPPASPEQVRQFEEMHNLLLPEEYKFFLTQIGNGGAGPYYGLYSLEEVERYTEYLETPETAAKARAAEDPAPAFIDRRMTPEDWAARMEELDNCSEEEYDPLMYQLCAGMLVIGTQGCTYDTVLMCQGSERGKIVYIDWNLEPKYGPYLTGMPFLYWYEMYFQEILQDHNLTSYGYLCLKSEEELIQTFRQMDSKTASEDNKSFPLFNKELLLSSLFRFKTAAAETIDFLAALKEPELDAMRTELLFRFDLHKGLQVFEQLLTGSNPEAAICCARRMPEEKKNRYYRPMLQLLYEGKITGKNRLLYFLRDCQCRRARDIIAFAMDPGNEEETRKTAVYVIGTCDDKMDFVKELSELMRGESYWLAHTALQAVFRTKCSKLDDTYLRMREKYKTDKMMSANLKIAFQTNEISPQ